MSTLTIPALPPLGALYLALNPQMVAEGFISQTEPRHMLGTGASLVDGTVYYVPIQLFAGQTVTNICVNIGGAGVGMSASKVGLYNTAMSRLAMSADLGTAWQTTGPKINALTAPYVVPANGVYYVAIFGKTATTMPSMPRGYVNSGTGGVDVNKAIGTGIIPFGTQTGQTDLPTTGAIAVGAAGTAFAFWAACS